MDDQSQVRPATSRFRWNICGLLFFATVIAYMDRGVLGNLELQLEQSLHFSSVAYGYISASFLFTYAIGFLIAGWLTDKLGIRTSFIIAIAFWSFAAMAPGAATSAVTLGVAMFLLGFGESANFPACMKTVAEWFPKRERALAAGLFNAGANVGNMLVPGFVAILATYLNWRMAFVAAGSLGFIWLIFWIWLYRKPEEHKSVSAEELALIQSDPIDERTATMSWLSLFPRRETWAFAIGKFLTDPIWWFWTFWLPRYFQKTFHLTLGKSSAPLMAIYAFTCVGSIGGGWLSSFLLGRGWSLNAARKTALLVCALCVLPVLYAPYVGNMWVVTGLVALACAAHQGFSANMLTMPSDLFPKSAIGSVVGIGSMCGAVVGCVLFISAGYISRISYTPLFVYAGSGYLVALALIHVLSPKLEPAKVD